MNASTRRAPVRPVVSSADRGVPESGIRVGLVGSCYWPLAGGMEMYLRQLATALANDGHGVSVATRFVRARPADVGEMHRGWEEHTEYDDQGTHVTVVAPSPGRTLLLRPVHWLHFRSPALAVRMTEAALGRQLRDALTGCDVIHYSGAGRELLGFVALGVAQRLDVPFVVTPHTHEGSWGDGSLDLDLYRRATRVVALTQDEAGRLARAGVDSSALRVIGHGVSVTGGGDAGRFRSKHELGDGPVVLYLGRKTPDKGFDLLLEAARSLWELVPDARIVLAGAPAAEKTLRPEIDDPRVVSLGHIDEAEREDAFAACDVFCLPSAAEAFGLVVLEAWSYGKPVVVSDIPTLRERLGAGGGLVVPREADAIAKALAALLLDSELRRVHGAIGNRIALASTWQEAARQTVDLYIDAGVQTQRRGSLTRDE